jgi:uncharacterized membrane protein YbhN (UPF0104 family)
MTIVLLGLLAWRMNWTQVAQAFENLHVELWLAAVGVLVLTQVLSAYRWQLLARPLGFHLPYSHFFGFYFIGMFFNLVMPTSVGGDVVRAWYLDHGPGRRMPAFVSVLVDRGSGLLVLLALACVSVAFCPATVPSWVPWSVWITAGAAAVGIAATLFLCFGPFARPEPGETAPTGVRRLVEAVRMLPAAYLTRPGLLLATTLLSVGVQAANVILVWLIGLAVDAPVPGVYYWVAVPMVSLLTVLPLSLNGMGIREGGLVLFLAPVGASAPTAVMIAFLWFAAATCASLAGGLVYLLGRFPRPEVRAEYEPVRRYPREGRARQSAAAA